jgi:hypothetical protein
MTGGTVLPAVGVRRLRDAGDGDSVPVYHGISYCDAVRRAGGRDGGPEGQALRVLPGSIEVCRWAPVVLGLKAAEDAFERRLAPHLAQDQAGLLLAPLEGFPGEPEVVLVRAEARELRARLARAGAESLWQGHGGQLSCSALPALGGADRGVRRRLIGAVNHMLAVPARWGAWQGLTRWLFRNRAVTVGFETLISRALADMSMCRNSTVIPLLSGRVNASFFCTGGITWGLNPPTYLVSGWPWAIYQASDIGASVQSGPETGP